jgi:hypothetical protein
MYQINDKFGRVFLTELESAAGFLSSFLLQFDVT